MKIRTESELFERIDHELVWRRTDLIRLRKVIVDNEKNNLIFKTLLRSAIPFVYSHWEGFIKESANYYFNFIGQRKLKYRELNVGILSLFIQGHFLDRSSSTNFEKAYTLLHFLDSNVDERSDIRSITNPIKTKSNLSSDVLKEIIVILDLDYEKFRAYENLIDGRLLEARNKIAHGEYREIKWDFYDDLHKHVVRLIEDFRDQIQNTVALGGYMKRSSWQPKQHA